MSIQKHKLYYLVMIIQLIVLLYYMFGKVNNKYERYPDYIEKLEDYKMCSKKLDSLLIERRKENELQNAWNSDSSSANTVKLLDRHNTYNIHNKEVNFIDSVKVHYVGKDGVEVITNYPFHKTIVD